MRTQMPASMTPPSERPVAAYIRVSTEEQARSGLGMDAQRRRCMAMAQVKDWPEPTFYVDDGVSGTKGPTKRPGLAQLVRDVKAGLYDAVIIHSLDRLGRKTSMVLSLVEEMTLAGVALVSCKEQLDTQTPQGQFVLTMFAALAQLERDLTAERTRAALAEAGRRNGDKGGRLPYGFRRTEPGVVAIDRHGAAVVRRIFELRASGRSLRAITDELNRAHMSSPRGGGQWQHTSVKEILSNVDAYQGGMRGASAMHWPSILHPSVPVELVHSS